VKRERLAVAGLLAALSLQLVYGAVSDGATDDEYAYLGSGVRHLGGDFRICPEHPPLAKLIGALPLQLTPLALPKARPEDDPWDEDPWEWTQRLIALNPGAPLLGLARSSMVALSLLVALLTWAWARRAAGPRAGVLALAVVAFHPALLAHGHLVTIDLATAFFMLAASGGCRLFLLSPTPWRGVLVGLALGLAVVTRFTAWILLPVFGLLALIAWRRSEARRAERTRAALLLCASLALVPVVIWACYGFRFAPRPGPPERSASWPEGAAGSLLARASDARLLPQAYLEGLRIQLAHNDAGHAAYLLGERSTSGWWRYFLVVLLVKSTPGFLLLLALAGWLAARGARPPDASHWLVPAAAVFLVASAGRIHIGERYVLAAYPYLILWIAASCAASWQSGMVRGLVWLALAAHAAPTLLVAPRGYLTYFNSIAGGPDGGHRWLADSNLDWGQDLPRLAAWMKRNQVARVQLAYFGTDDPDRYGIAHDDLPTTYSIHAPHLAAEPLAGTIVVSPNLLLGFLFPPGQDPYRALRERPPDARAGIFFVFRR
jgi:hypothetical protein